MATINVAADATVMSGSEVAKLHTRDEPNTLRHMGCVAIDSGGLLLRQKCAFLSDFVQGAYGPRP